MRKPSSSVWNAEAMQCAVADCRRHVAHANDVAEAPFVDGVDVAAQTASEWPRVLPARILPDLAEIVTLRRDAAGHAIAKRAQSDLHRREG